MFYFLGVTNNLLQIFEKYKKIAMNTTNDSLVHYKVAYESKKKGNKMSFLTKKAAQEWLASQGIHLSISTLNKLIVQGTGCPYQKFAGKVLYDKEQFINWTMSKFNTNLTKEVKNG